MNKLSQIKDILQSEGLRITQSRLSVATILIKNNALLTPEEIYNRILKSKTLSSDQASVYRTLSTFEELGLVKKSIFQGEPARYMLESFEKKKCQGHDHDHDHAHEHYFKCVKCKKIEPFTGCLVSQKEKELEKKGYRNLSHHLEITGICPSCAKAS
ncbi:MAG: Fur family transcriptional regulator [Bacteriovoracaceae bacterium]